MNTKITKEGWAVAEGDSHISKWIEEIGDLQHDLFLPPFVVSKLKQGDCVIDLGANLGSHSIAYSKAVGAAGIVIAVEAGQLAFECLKHNAGLFQHKNVFPLHSAVSDFCGESISHTQNDNLGASVCTLVERDKLVEGEKYLMTVTIDYLASLCAKKIDFIKMDVEGWEVKALIGGAKTLRDHKPQMMIEINEGALKAQGSKPADILEILILNNYTYEIVQPESKWGDPQFDIFCKPKKDLALPSLLG